MDTRFVVVELGWLKLRGRAFPFAPFDRLHTELRLYILGDSFHKVVETRGLLQLSFCASVPSYLMSLIFVANVTGSDNSVSVRNQRWFMRPRQRPLSKSPNDASQLWKHRQHGTLLFRHRQACAGWVQRRSTAPASWYIPRRSVHLPIRCSFHRVRPPLKIIF